MKKLSTLFVLLGILLIASNFCIVSCPDDDDDDAGEPTPTPTATPTQQYHSISGTVYDNIYNPVSGITVFTEGIEVQTDHNGHYMITDIPMAKHVVTAVDTFVGVTLQTVISESETVDIRFTNFLSYNSQGEGVLEGDLSGYSDYTFCFH